MTEAANMDDRDLLTIIQDGIATSVCFENDPGTALSAGAATSPVGEGQRSDALDYYKGVMNDLPAELGWSQAVSRDVLDTINQQMPGLMRVFAGDLPLPGGPGWMLVQGRSGC